ncbi:hypothetical protein Tco_0581356 [Tanacetum coccineum]
MGIMSTKAELALEQTQQGASDEVTISASAAAKPGQGDSFEFYLITSSIYSDQQGTVVQLVHDESDSMLHAHTRPTNVKT